MSRTTAKSPWFVYLLRCADNSLYCGVTTDIQRRLDEHNSGTGARYTRGRGPVRIETYAPFPDRATACRIEYAVKQQPAARKCAFLKHMQEECGLNAHLAECGLELPSE